MSETIKEKIISTLIKSKHLTKADINSALDLQKKAGIGLDKALIQKGLINEKDLMVLLVKELHIPFINLKKYKVQTGLKEMIPEKIARQYRIIPLSQLENTLTIALSDPLNIFIIDDLKSITGKDIDVMMSTDSEIMGAIDTFYGSRLQSTVADVSKDIDVGELEIVSEQEKSQDSDAAIDEGEQAPIIRMVNLVIKEAIKQRASDIHMEPTADEMRVRYRIDGVLQDALRVPQEHQNAVTVRIKIMSRLDITTSRTPQDGRFKLRIGNQEVDFRVSVLPTIFGQKIVMRVLDRKNLKVGLDGLGFTARDTDVLKIAIKKPFGMILVTGPTGSGKSTTLYSIINELNTVDKNIITVEDPVEYLIEGLTQIQARPEIGLTFSSGLRSILRQSPDIVMVGEIRDSETADIAIKASLTGQLVFSTLHTNDAAGALTRLVDMGIESFLVASSLVCVCAQRLCRRICPSCKQVQTIPKTVLEEIPYPIKPGTVFHHGKGCSKCRQTGYIGRMGVTEILAVDDTVRDMLIRQKSSDEIKKYAVEKNGMTTLWEDIMQKAAGGQTTIEEVFRVTSSD